MDKKQLVKFIYELGQLKRIRHEGYSLIGVDRLETVAEHSLRAAQIGYFLALLEAYPNPFEVVTTLVFHDIGECRVGDVHKVARRYVDSHEDMAVKDQTKRLGEAGAEIFRLWRAIDEKKTPLGIITKDADYLEMAFTSKELLEKGYEFAKDWLDNIKKVLKTKSAHDLLMQLKKTNSNEWWQGLKKI